MNIASKFGFKNTGNKSRSKSPTKKPYRSPAKKIDWDLAHANESRARDYRLDRLQEIQHDIYNDSPQWSPELKELMSFMWDNFKPERFPVLGAPIWEQFITISQAGPRHQKVLSGEFQSMLLWIMATLLQIQ